MTRRIEHLLQTQGPGTGRRHAAPMSLIVRAMLLAFALCLSTTLLAQSTAPASKPLINDARQPAPTTVVPQTGCVTSDCHANIKNFKVVHGPVNVNACDACHTLADAKTHRFTAARDKANSCAFCHQMDTASMPVVHKPMQTGDCVGCHNPHGGKTKMFLRGDTMAQVCNNCHQDVMAGKKTVHGPVAAGACDACHQPHASRNEKLLIAEGKDLCFFCHKEMAAQVKSAKARHKPVSDSECGKCHDPHASNFPKQTRMAPLQLCTSCHQHEDILKQATQSTHTHSVVTEKDACMNCHTAHGGQLAALVRKEPLKLCMDCHAKPIREPSGHQVAAVTEITDAKTMKHGPIRDGSCAGCHNPHGTQTANLLTKPYPETFYQAFALEKYALCFSCHDSQLVQAREARGLTNFRNGDENLHFVHVNRERGRNCRSCHSTHASLNDLHVRDSVPYGKWTMPITFQKSADGGSCSPGCHKPYSYDRVKPVPYDSADQAGNVQSANNVGTEARSQ